MTCSKINENMIYDKKNYLLKKILPFCIDRNRKWHGTNYGFSSLKVQSRVYTNIVTTCLFSFIY